VILAVKTGGGSSLASPEASREEEMADPVMTGRFENLGDLLEAVASEHPGAVAFTTARGI
jgi:hypothetical protein